MKLTPSSFCSQLAGLQIYFNVEGCIQLSSKLSILHALAFTKIVINPKSGLKTPKNRQIKIFLT
jgi:hypothetical protein